MDMRDGMAWSSRNRIRRAASKEWRGRVDSHADIVASFDRIPIDVNRTRGAELFGQRERRGVTLEGVNPELQVEGLLSKRVGVERSSGGEEGMKTRRGDFTHVPGCGA